MPTPLLAIKTRHYQANRVCLQLCPLDLEEKSKDSGLGKAGPLAAESKSTLTPSHPDGGPVAVDPSDG